MFDLCLTFDLLQIRQDLAANGIRVYPQKEYDEDPEEHILNERIRVTPPVLLFIVHFVFYNFSLNNLLREALLGIKD